MTLKQTSHFCVSLLHYGEVATTLTCIASFLRTEMDIDIYIVNNSGDPKIEAEICKKLERQIDRINIVTPHKNLGFAGGHNFAVQHFSLTSYEKILFFNNDAVISKDALHEMISSTFDWAGSKLLHPTGALENMGITLYKSGYPSHRRNEQSPLLGPSGASFVLTKKTLQHILKTYGYLFDEDFFLYIEDTDLAARLYLLGYTPHIFTHPIIHQGGAGSGGGYNNLIAYYGIRNCFFFRWKYFGTKKKFWFILGDIASCLAAFLQRKGTIWRKARKDARALQKHMLDKHTQILHVRTRALPIDTHFFLPGHIHTLLRQIFSRK